MSAIPPPVRWELAVGRVTPPGTMQESKANDSGHPLAAQARSMHYPGEMKLLIATRNAHKLQEIRALFDLPGLDIISALDDPGLPDIVEDGDTLEANAIKKAATLAPLATCWALADDTGLEVDALDGAPGVYSARYAGEEVSYADNNRKLLRELEGQENRRASFRCVIALSDPSGRTETVEGRCEGKIGFSVQGSGGFGYDPLFIPEGFDKTFAELGEEVKNKISHRSKALAAARSAWGNTLSTTPKTDAEKTTF